MRNEAKTPKAINYNGIQGYHAGAALGGNYARQGFTGGFRFYASDRPIPAAAKNKGYGLEIEMTSHINSGSALAVILDRVVFPTFPAGLFKMQRDGSLGGASSAECITQPMSKAFIRNQYNNFKAMWDFLSDIGTGPDCSCGMHTNISMACFGSTRAKQEAAILRLHNWLANNYGLACALFKRDPAHTMYCGRMNTMRELVPTGSHGTMCNYSHINEGDAARVELRLVGPQRSFGAFRNTLECVFYLVEAAKDGKDFSDLVRLFSGCNECVTDRLKDLVGSGHITVEQYEAIKAASVNTGIRAATRTR
jgi:hypothetical protein